jgi:hypothetical protein
MPNTAVPGPNVNLYVTDLTTANTSSNENNPSIEYQTFGLETAEPSVGEDVEIKVTIKLDDGQPIECKVTYGDVTRTYTSGEIDLQELYSLFQESMTGDPFEYTFPAIQAAVPRGGRRRRRRATKRRRSTKRKSRRRN